MLAKKFRYSRNSAGSLATLALMLAQHALNSPSKVKEETFLQQGDYL